MRHDATRQTVFTRRAAMLMGGQAALFGVLIGRMYYLQVVESDQYAVLADENRIQIRLLPPVRGRIVDRFGEELANSKQNLRVLMIPEAAGNVERVLAALRRAIPIAEHDERRILREVRRKRKFLPVTVAENLSWEQFAAVNLHSPDLPGVQPDIGETRGYPMGEAFAHLIGYVAPVAEADLTGEPLLELPGFRIGKNGVERLQDIALRGKAGSSRVEVNALGRTIRELSRDDGQRGADVALTVDATLQRFAAERLDGESASAVVMDVHTGDLLTLLSVPGYDPAAFNTGLTQRAWQELVSNPLAPLVSKSIAGQYPPGSTFKMMTALAGLDAGVVTPDTRLPCTGSIELGPIEFHCWKRKPGHGALRMAEALEQSCDCYFYELARRVGPDRIAAICHKFGLGHSHQLGLPGERPGLIPTRQWKQTAQGQPWTPGDSFNAGIGQGFVLSTPLQLCVMAARIANGGLAVRPRLLLDIGGEAMALPPAPALGVNPAQLKIVQDGMFRVVNGDFGTAKRSRIAQAGWAFAGKTGSSQVRRISKQERTGRMRKNEEKPWIERDHALFVGYAPYEAPRYAVAVLVEHGGSGSGAAAPVARDIMMECLKRDPSRRGPGERSA